MPTKKPSKNRGTRWGHHTYLDFRKCPRLYWLKHLAPTEKGFGWESPQGNSTMSLGTIGHAFLHGFHEKGTVKAGEKAFRKCLEEEKTKWEILRTPEVVTDLLDAMALIVKAYPVFHDQWERQKGPLKFIAFEQEAEIVLPGFDVPVPYTTRRDAIAFFNSDRWVMEAKFSTMTFDRMKDYHRLGGQTSGYIISDQVVGIKTFGAIVNHIRPLKTPQFERHLILKTPADLEKWAQSIYATYVQITKRDPTKMDEWNQHLDECVTYLGTCPMRDVCIMNSEGGQHAVLHSQYRAKEGGAQ